MMKITRSLWGIAACFFLFSCNKDRNNDVSVVTPVQPTVDSIFSLLRLSPKVLTVNAAAGGSFFGNSGTRFFFYPNSFQTATGAIVTEDVQVSVTEYLKAGDMIFSKMLPVSDGEPLLSGGEFNISAAQNGQQVYLRPHYTFMANIPCSGADVSGMQFFVGRESVDTTQMLVNWVVPKVDSQNYHLIILPQGPKYTVNDTLRIISDSLKMTNADRFMSSPNYQRFTVTASAPGIVFDSNSYIMGYALYDTYLGAWPMRAFDKGVFYEGHVPDIPVHFVVFGLIDGKFYGGVTAATPVTGANYIVNMTVEDPVTFKAQLNGL